MKTQYSVRNPPPPHLVGREGINYTKGTMNRTVSPAKRCNALCPMYDWNGSSPTYWMRCSWSGRYDGFCGVHRYLSGQPTELLVF